MPIYMPPEIDAATIQAIGDTTAPGLPKTIIESQPVDASLRLKGVNNESEDYAPRVNKGSILTDISQGDRVTVLTVIADPFEGLVQTAQIGIDPFGLGAILPVGEPVLTPVYEAAPPPTPPPPDIPPPPVLAPVPEYIPPPAPAAPDPGVVETLPVMPGPQPNLEEQLLAGGCATQTEVVTDPFGTIIGFQDSHWDGFFWNVIGFEALF